MSSSRRRTTALLGVILMGALALRLWGSTFGIPFDYAADEWRKVIDSYHLPQTGFIHTNRQPSFLYYSLFAIYSVTGWVKPLFDKIVSFRSPYPADYAPFGYALWLGRVWMAILGTATVYFVFLIGRNLGSNFEASVRSVEPDGSAGIPPNNGFGEKAGLLGAAFYAIAPLPVVSAHYIKEDTPLALAVAVCVVLCLHLMERGGWREHAFAGLAAGIAFGVKFPGAIMLPLVIACSLLRRSPSHDKRVNNICLATISFFAGFSVINPLFVIHIRYLWDGIAYQTQYALSGHHDRISISALEQGFLFHFRYSILPGLTVPIVVMSILGLILLVLVNKGIGWVLAGYVMLFYLSAEISRAKPYPMFARYILPLVPVMCASAGIAVAWLWQWNSKKRSPAVAPASISLMIALILIWPLILSILRVVGMVPDTRDQAHAYIHNNIPSNAIILQTDYCPFIDPERFETKRLLPESLKLFRPMSVSRPVFCVISSIAYDRYLKYPDKVPDMTVMFVSLIEGERPVAVFRRPLVRYGFNNPDILIYRL